MKKPKNLYECMGFITKVQCFYTMGPFRRIENSFQVTKGTVIYTNVGMVIGLALMFYGAHFKLTHPEHSTLLRKMNPLTMVIVAMEIILASIAYVVINIYSQVQKYKQIELIDKVHIIDQNMLREFPIDLNYYKLRKKNIILLFVNLSFYYTSANIMTYRMVENDLWITIGIVVGYLLATGAGGVCTYVGGMNYSDILRIRFRLMQKMFLPSYMTETYPDPDLRTKKIGMLITYYKDYVDLMEEINDLFGPPLLAILLHDFCKSTSQIFLLFWTASSNDENKGQVFLAIFLVMIPTIWKMFLTPLYAHLSYNEAKSCIRLISHLDKTTTNDENLKWIIQGFNMWEQHNTNQYTVAGFFALDMTLAFSVAAGLANYVLVLIQFKMQEEDFNAGTNITDTEVQ